jgi:hypothetical protein
MSRIGCPLFCVASDGESHRGSTLTQLTHKALLNPCSELYGLLGNLRLLNLLVGDHNITANKDPKHVMKRCRNFSICKSGVMVNNFLITPALLRFHLHANKVPSHWLNYLLNPTDRQDVPLCFSLMKEIWSLPPVTGWISYPTTPFCPIVPIISQSFVPPVLLSLQSFVLPVLCPSSPLSFQSFVLPVLCPSSPLSFPHCSYHCSLFLQCLPIIPPLFHCLALFLLYHYPIVLLSYLTIVLTVYIL